MEKDVVVHEGDPKTAIDAYRMSTDAANICKEIVLSTVQEISGKKHVRVEGWQAIAIAHGCTASSGDVEQTETGIKAIGRIIRMSDGVVISQAEGFVGDDEPTWGKRPEYARRAMAQTRAISRACRSAFAHVVVMMNAGLSTTPAEEMTDHSSDAKDTRTITESQAKRLFAIAKSAGWDEPEIKKLLAKSGYTSSKDIKRSDYEEICKKLESGEMPEGEIPFK